MFTSQKFFAVLLGCFMLLPLAGCQGGGLALGPFSRFRTTHVNLTGNTQVIKDARSGQEIIVPPGGDADLPYVWSGRDRVDTPIIVREYDHNGNLVNIGGTELIQRANRHRMIISGEAEDMRRFGRRVRGANRTY